MSEIYRGLFALIGWATLALQYWLHYVGRGELTPFAQFLNYFSYFTILTNILAAILLTLPVVAGDRPIGRWAAYEGPRSAVTMFIVVVGLSYHFLLAATWNPQGLLYPVNMILHYVMPIAMLIDWLAFTPKGRLRWIDPVKWLAFPLAYGVWTVIHGLTAHWWPYWFINIEDLGWARAGAGFAALLVFFLAVGLILVLIDRTLGRRVSVETA